MANDVETNGLAKGHVKPHRRRLKSGKVVQVEGYHTKKPKPGLAKDTEKKQAPGLLLQIDRDSLTKTQKVYLADAVQSAAYNAQTRLGRIARRDYKPKFSQYGARIVQAAEKFAAWLEGAQEKPGAKAMAALAHPLLVKDTIEIVESWAEVKERKAADYPPIDDGAEACLQEAKEIRELVGQLRKLTSPTSKIEKAVGRLLLIASATRQWLLVKSARPAATTVFIGAPVPAAVRTKFKHLDNLVDQLHMTVLYIPEGPAGQTQREAILDAVDDVTSRTPPLTCKATGIGVLGAHEKVLAALITVANGAKFHADLCDAIAGRWDSFERTFDFLPHVTLCSTEVDEANAKDLRKVRWTADHVTVQFGKGGAPHRFNLRGPRSRLRVLFKSLAPGPVLGPEMTTPLEKAVIRTPTDASGSVAWDKVPVGASIWVTITKEGPLRGRKLLLTKRPDQQFAVTWRGSGLQ